MNKILTIALLIAFAATNAPAAPEPAVIQPPGLWTLDTEFKHLQPFKMQTEQGKPPARFWYMIMTLTNKTGHEVSFFPGCELMTDTYQIIPAGKNVPEAVYNRLIKRYRRSYPFLRTLPEAGTKILQGENNAMDLLIVWPDFDPEANRLKAFISGLSNETAVVEHPTAENENGEPLKIYLRKTLELNYDIGGDPATSPRLRISYQGKDWVMR
jgi:hypothetical protein